ncbi:carboxypeptidase-like regulatory domain-containing protein [Enhygromyxa salina]|uniref:Uncharacterized protein n=1 Tax=Enhygromyxa salina TaxID=215803 RepID=A0A2S9YSB1_9BACT|nr:carboxypeptidase-like regulatory domain-containing protein [Enhygromyxa salina]PRQ07929.1 hypothetical protein ENSA7_23680 [Enhygromyxa salina]
MNSRRAWVLLGVALAAMLTVVGVWWSADRPSVAARSDARDTNPAATARAHSRADPHATRGEGIAELPILPGAPLIGGVFVSPDEGPLTLGAIELWCADGQPGARAQLTEDGSLLAPACPTTTCVRLRHPAFEQPSAWELAPDERREFEVAAAPKISGIVRSPLGDAVVDASLAVRSDDGRRAHARTDMDGEFAVALPGLRPCDACDLQRGPPTCREAAPSEDRLRAQVLVSAPAFAPTELEVELDAQSDAVSELVLDPAAAPITGVVRGSDGELFDDRTKILATNSERPDEQHHARVVDGQFALAGLAQARYRLRAVRDGRELGILASVSPGDEVELNVEQPARGVTLELLVLHASGRPADGVRVDGGPFVGGGTDHEGHLAAADVAPGDYTLRLRAAECSVVRAVVEVTSQPTGPRRTLHLPSACEPD